MSARETDGVHEVDHDGDGPVALLTGALPRHVAPIGRVAIDDPSTAEVVRNARRRSRRLVIGSVAAWILAWAAAFAAEPLSLPDGVNTVVFLLWVATGLVMIVVLMTQPVRRRPWKDLGAGLRSEPWQLAEVVLLRGAPIDGLVSMVLLLDPTTGQPAGSWIVDQVRSPTWLAPATRTWAYYNTDGSDVAALAPLDRRGVVTLRAKSGLGKSPALHEWAWEAARSQFTFGPPDRSATGSAIPMGQPAELAAPGTQGATGPPQRWPNRPLTNHQRVMIVLTLTIASIGVTAWSSKLEHDDVLHAQRMEDSGSRSTAVVESRTDMRRSGSAQLGVLLVDGDREGWGVRTSVQKSSTLRPGDLVTVAYDPRDVGDLIILGEPLTDRGDLDVFAWAVTAMVAGRFAWQALRGKRT